MSFDDSSLNYFFSLDHKQGEDLEFCQSYFNNRVFDTLLDVASAAGHFAKSFEAKMKIAADISFNMLKTAREKNSLKHLIQCRAENLPFKNNIFDIVTCRIAVHHFENPKSFFKETFRVLKRRGFFILIDNIVDIDDEYLNKIELIRDDTHIKSYTITEILSFADGHFRLLTFHTVFKKHDFLQWATRLQADKAAVSKIEKAFLILPKFMTEELKVEVENSHIKSYTDKKGIFIFQKMEKDS